MMTQQMTNSMKFCRMIKRIEKAKGLEWQLLMRKARKLHREMSDKDLEELVYDAQKFTDKNIRTVLAIGLREPAATKIIDYQLKKAGIEID